MIFDKSSISADGVNIDVYNVGLTLVTGENVPFSTATSPSSNPIGASQNVKEIVEVSPILIA